MTPRVAYLVSRFPKTSETFIVDEVLALEASGVEVRLIALASGRGETVGDDARRLAERVQRLSHASPRLLVAQLRWFARAPLRLVGLWARVIARHAASPRALVRAVVAVAHACAHAEALTRAGVRHVHAHWATHPALAAWAIGRLTGLPYSFTAHADDLFVARPMLEEKVRDASFVVTISEFNRAWLLEHVAAAADTRIEVVRCGIPLARFEPAPPVAASEPFTIACVARLEPKKGHVHLLDACARVAARGVPLRCRLIGDGRLRRDLEERIARLGIGEQVELLGARPREEVARVVASAHVFALPSVTDPNGRADGIPVALMEAMAMQRPVVSTPVSGIPELITHGVDGLLVRPGDPEALADALDRLRVEPGLAERLAVAGRRRIRAAHDLDDNVARLRALLLRDGEPPPLAGGRPAIARLGTTGEAR